MLGGAAALALTMPGAVRAAGRCVLDPCLGAVLMDADPARGEATGPADAVAAFLREAGLRPAGSMAADTA